MSVPQFGGWDQKAPGTTDYSMVFSRARANRKQKRTDVRRSLGSEQELISAPLPQQRQEEECPVSVRFPFHNPLIIHYMFSFFFSFPINSITMQKKKKILTYINCCIRPTSQFPSMYCTFVPTHSPDFQSSGAVNRNKLLAYIDFIGLW